MNDEIAIFGVEYESLPATFDSYPDIFYLFLNFFEKNISRFTYLLFHTYKLSSKIPDINEECDKEMITVYSQFTKLLKKLPHAFIEDELSYLYMENPSKDAANFLLASLSESKFKCLNRFINIVIEAKKGLIHPLSYDSDLCLLFTHNKSVFGLFNYLTEQSDAFSVFPFLEFRTVIPPKPPNSYPDIDILSFTILNEQRSKERFENIVEQTSKRTLKDLYEDAIDHANYMGLNDECLGEISQIPINDAQFHKQALKSILNDFEKEYQDLFNEKPNKVVREHILVLYNLYKKLKKRCNRTHLDDLMDEKNLLQNHLNEFRKEFKRKYGRDIETEEDKEPIKDDYKRYKEIKQEIYYITHENTG